LNAEPLLSAVIKYFVLALRANEKTASLLKKVAFAKIVEWSLAMMSARVAVQVLIFVIFVMVICSVLIWKPVHE
jgi:hypothetical protein